MISFLEDRTDQGYLDYLEDKEVNYLDLFNLMNSLKNNDFSGDPEDNTKCPKKLLTSFGLSPYQFPFLRLHQDIKCPSMNETCCSQADMTKLDQIWEERFSVYLELNHDYFRYYLIQILSSFEQIKNKAFIVKDLSRHRMCTMVSNKLINSTLNHSTVEDLKQALKHLNDFDVNQKDNFACFLCDFNSVKNWDVQYKIIPLSYDICETIVENTFD